MQWTAFPEQAIEVAAGIRILGGRRWPLALTAPQLETVTANPAIPRGSIITAITWSTILCAARTYASKLCGIGRRLPVTGDIYTAVFAAAKRHELRQGAAKIIGRSCIRARIRRIARGGVCRRAPPHRQAQTRWPGLDAVGTGGELRLAIPKSSASATKPTSVRWRGGSSSMCARRFLCRSGTGPA